MADSNTTTYSFTLPEVGASADSWGTKLNANWDKVDDLLDGSIAVNGITVTGGSIDGTPVGATTPSTGAFTTVTTTGNVDVTGTVTADGLTVENGTVTFGGEGISSAFINTPEQMFFNVDSNNTPEASGFEFGAGRTGSTGGKKRLKIGGDGDVSFYEDTGTTAKMVWDASAETLKVASAVKLYGDGAGGGIEFGSDVNTYAAVRADSPAAADIDLTFHTSTSAGGDGAPERMRIDSAGNVGIGTASPTAPLTISGGNDLEPVIKASDGGANGYTMLADNYTSTDSQVNLGIMYGSASAVLSWGVKANSTSDAYVSSTGLYSKAPQSIEMDTDGIKFLQGANATVATNSAVSMSERARIDSSGNLLVGKTSTAFGTDGVEIKNDQIWSTNTSSDCLSLNRKTTDGAIVSFYKDSSVIGSIGTFGSTPFIQAGSAADYCGLLFNNAGGEGYIQPTKSTGASGADPRTDNAVNLGNSSHRFKDLYLSGGVKTGGGGTNSTGVVEFVADSTRAKIEGGYQSGGGGYLKFHTDTTGGSDLERMRIDSSGNLLVGKTSADGGTDGFEARNGGYTYVTANDINGALFVRERNTSNSGSRKVVVITGGTFNTADNTSDLIEFRRGDGTAIGTVQRSGSNGVSYVTSSDYRLKENIESIDNASSRVLALKPCRFNFIDAPDTTVDGFIAHEAQEVVPEAVTGTKDAVDSDGNPKYQGIDQAKLVPLLTAALQEALTEIDSLKQRVDALENN